MDYSELHSLLATPPINRSEQQIADHLADLVNAANENVEVMRGLLDESRKEADRSERNSKISLVFAFFSTLSAVVSVCFTVFNALG